MAKKNTQVKSKGKSQKYVNNTDKAAENAKLEAKIAEKTSAMEKERQDNSKALFERREPTEEEKEFQKRQMKERAESEKMLRKLEENLESKDNLDLAKRVGLSAEEIGKVSWKIESYNPANEENHANIRVYGEVDKPTDVVHLDKLHPYTLMEITGDRELQMKKGKVEREGNTTYLRARATRLVGYADSKGNLDSLEVCEPFRRAYPHDLSMIKAGSITAERAKSLGYNFVTLV